MRDSLGSFWKRALAVLAMVGLSLLSACGGGNTNTSQQPTGLEAGDASDIKLVLNAVPVTGGGGGGGSNTVRLAYHRPDGDYAGWTVYVFNAPGEALGSWPGKPPAGDEPGFGKYWEIPVGGASFNFIIVKDGGSTREPSAWSGQTGSDAQQFWAVADGKAIFKIAGDSTNFKTNPLGTVLDINAVRVHYLRFDGGFANWGVHIWPASGLDVAGLKPGVVIDQWTNAVPFSDFNNFAAVGASEVVFDIPVLNPKDDDTRKALEFIIHGKPPGGDPNDKDGRNDNIKVTYSGLTVNNKVGDIWLVQGDPAVYTSRPDSRVASTTDARAHWLTADLVSFPIKGDTRGPFKLYRSATGQIKAAKDAAVEGADGSITLDVFTGSVPPAAAERFKFVAPGVVLQVKSGDRSKLPDLHKDQLVLVQEDSAGLVQNATTAQTPGALDDLYADATAVSDLGVRLSSGKTSFKLWAPSAQKVSVAIYNSATGPTVALLPAKFDKKTGVWSASGNAPAGYYYRYVVEVFARGVGLVRNLVTDPYSISLSTDSARSYIHDLASQSLKPAGWDGSAPPAKVKAQTDMSIYELHVRDFSANDQTVSLPNRGKYLAFTESNSNGMRHLRALAQAGLTDVHLLPVFDLATVPEGNCAQIATGGAADSERQQADVGAVRDADCFNWGYDPYHFNAPEGSFASSAGDGARRIIELRSMVQALHGAGLRVGMDVVYNHTTASGQNAKSVLDRIVPGYYHRLSNVGEVEKSTCCDNTATENLMMGKLMIDSTVLWATEYGIDSFRFDLMGHQPRAVMEQLQTAVNAATGRTINLIGEGWNFGEVQNNARFRQASQLELNGSGIGTFSDRARDYVRGGSPFDGGDNLIANQGYVNGLFYDPNALGGNKSKNDLMWAADVIKVGLAGSIRSFVMTTHWDATLKLEEINYNGQPAGYVTSPAEVVNYVENHDNQTLFDINAFKMPTATSREDRARSQMLAAAINAFSQGVAYYHAGIDTLRSKSMDRDSYNSGDWFNRIDWTYQDNYFGTGLPIQDKNGDNWGQMRPLLTNPDIKPGAGDIAWTRDAFRDLLAVRASSTLFRLRTGDDIKSRLTFHNTGSGQVPTILAGHLNGAGYSGARFKEVLYLVNVDKVEQSLTIDALKGKSFVLHPVQADGNAADKRPADAVYTKSSGRFTVPARTAVVFVVN